MKKIYSTLILLTLLLLAGCSSAPTDPAKIYQNQTAAQIFRGGEINVAKGSYSTATQQFEGLDALYPFSDYDQQAQLDLMYAYYKNDDMASTGATAERFIRIYPRSEHVDYAYYMKGLADFYQNRGWLLRYFPLDLSERDPGNAQQAFQDFQTLIELFPSSTYAPDARQRMVYLRNMFAAHELHVAQYYMQRKAYVAAANRANYILQHYNGAPQTEDALGILVKAYYALGLTNPAKQALEILTFNYPNGQIIQELRKEKV